VAKGKDYKGGLLGMLADEVIMFNAPHNSIGGPGRYHWFLNPTSENKNHNIMPELKRSVEYIVGEIRSRNLDEKDLILYGSSQGAFMALYLTLNNIIVPKKTIAAVPFYARELITNKINKATPILWLAAEHDEMIPREYCETWMDLQSAGANLDYHIDANSEHTKWSPEFIQYMIDWNKGKRIC